jgi:hypothetical protein
MLFRAAGSEYCAIAELEQEATCSSAAMIAANKLNEVVKAAAISNQNKHLGGALGRALAIIPDRSALL